MEKVINIQAEIKKIQEESEMKQRAIYKSVLTRVSKEEIVSFFINNDIRVMMAAFLAWKKGEKGAFARKYEDEVGYNGSLSDLNLFYKDLNVKKVLSAENRTRYTKAYRDKIATNVGVVEVFSCLGWEGNASDKNGNISLLLSGEVYFEMLDEIFEENIERVNQQIDNFVWPDEFSIISKKDEKYYVGSIYCPQGNAIILAGIYQGDIGDSDIEDYIQEAKFTEVGYKDMQLAIAHIMRELKVDIFNRRTFNKGISISETFERFKKSGDEAWFVCEM